ncbi:TolC family protein [Polaribacter sp.]|uniref:TolC family protein n=1 Tax=Polaribacter sp. TaxID=1920175 RepID=UPI003F6C4BD2
MKKINLIFFIALAGLVQSAIAQQVVNLTQTELIETVKEQNIALKISDQSYLKAKADFKETNAIFLPSITASHTGMVTTNPLAAFGAKLNQEILTQADFNPVLLNNPNQTQNFSTIIEVQQPLFNMDGLYQRKATKIKKEATYLQTQRGKEYLILDVKKTYMNLQLAYKSVAVLEQTLQTAKAKQQIANNHFKEGYLKRSDVLEVEVYVNEVENSLQTAKSNVINISGYLSFLMNKKQEVVFKPTDSLVAKNTNILNDAQLSTNRSDVKAMELVVNANKEMHNANRVAFLPRLNAFGSYQLYDNNAFATSADGYIVGAQLSWDIFKGAKRFAKQQQSKATFEKSKLEYQQYKTKSELTLNKTKRQLADLQKQIVLKKLNVEQSEEMLKIKTNRFKEGLEKTADVLLAETMFVQKELDYYQTIYQFNYTNAYLEFLIKKN